MENSKFSFNTIGLAYFYYKNNCLNMDIFNNEESAKEWLFLEFKKHNILTNWYDDEKNMNYYGFDEIHYNIKALTLKEIINGTVVGGDIDIIVKYN